MKDRAFYSMLHRFLVYREGTAVNWDCTFADLSAATGIGIGAIKHYCSSDKWIRRGWHPRHGVTESQERSGGQSLAVDTLMAMPDGHRHESPFHGC